MSEPPSFVLVIPWSPAETGGVNEAVFGVARELEASRKYRPLIAVASWSPFQLPDRLRGIPVCRIPMHDIFGKGATLALKSAAHCPGDLPALARFLRENNTAVVMSVFPGIGSASFLLLKWLGMYRGKVALWFQGLDVSEVEQSPAWLKVIWRRFVEGVDAVYTCSNALGARVREIAPRASVQTAYNGVDHDLFRIARCPHGSPKRILNIGKYEHKKGQDVLLAAFRQLLDRGMDVQLTLIGASGHAVDNIRRTAAAFGERVRMLTDVPHDDIPKHMSQADLFVLPSRAEPFGIVLVEAGAAGLPVIASRVGGIPELLTHCRTGLLVEPDDADGLCCAMIRVLLDTGLAETLAENWHREAMNYTWRNSTDGLLRGLGEAALAP